MIHYYLYLHFCLITIADFENGVQKTDANYVRCDVLLYCDVWCRLWPDEICLFVCVESHEQFFQAIWRLVTITGDRAAKSDLWLALTAFSSEGSFTCRTYCQTGPPFFRSYSKDPWFSLLNDPWGTGLEYILHIPLCVIRGDWIGRSIGWDRKNRDPVSQVWHDRDPSLLKGPEQPFTSTSDVSI
jgi:hypothetical protein